MKKLLVFSVVALLSTSAFAQDPITRYLEGRFGGPATHTFIPKGSHAVGISGGYRSLDVVGDDATGAGYSLISLLNIGDGHLKIWNVSPSFSTFLADDLCLNVALHYNGYQVNTDLKLDFGNIVTTDDQGNVETESLNFAIYNRAMTHHVGGASIALRKYMPFFGSKTIAVFGEGRLQGTYGVTNSSPRNPTDANKERVSHSFGVALKACGGIAFKLQDNTAITVSIPIFGIAYDRTTQDRTTTKTDNAGNPVTIKSRTHMSSFNASRNVDLLGIQFGFVRYIEPKRK